MSGSKFRGSRVQYGYGVGNMFASMGRQLVRKYLPVIKEDVVQSVEKRVTSKKRKKNTPQKGRGRVKRPTIVSRDVIQQALASMNKKRVRGKKKITKKKPVRVNIGPANF